jgi:hypothetical protein
VTTTTAKTNVLFCLHNYTGTCTGTGTCSKYWYWYWYWRGSVLGLGLVLGITVLVLVLVLADKVLATSLGLVYRMEIDPLIAGRKASVINYSVYPFFYPYSKMIAHVMSKV